MKKVSNTLYKLLGEDYGAGLTEIVRCFSEVYTKAED